MKLDKERRQTNHLNNLAAHDFLDYTGCLGIGFPGFSRNEHHLLRRQSVCCLPESTPQRVETVHLLDLNTVLKFVLIIAA